MRCIIMKLISVLTAAIFLSCGSNHSDASRLNALINDDAPRKIIISCIRCGCVDDEINNILSNTPARINTYKIYCDTLCKGSIDSRVKMIDIRQQWLDSLMPDFYNIMIIKDGRSRMLTTEEVKQLSSYL
jgi:hypothetical protein